MMAERFDKQNKRFEWSFRCEICGYQSPWAINPEARNKLPTNHAEHLYLSGVTPVQQRRQLKAAASLPCKGCR